MLYHVEGTITDIESNLVVVDCHGVGYALNTSLNTIAAVRIGEISKLYIYESVREDAFDLFGFASKEEKRCFEMLIGISGVGPKAAISILSTLSPEDVALAVGSGDYKAITRANGVGPKIAQRVVLELKDKFKSMGAPADLSKAAQTGAGSASNNAAAAINAYLASR